MQEGITLITPTGDRYLAFKICEMWMSRQTMPYNQWIVVDDGITRHVPATLSQDVITRKRGPNEPPHTLHLNILEALPHIKYNKILIIEDDDYYAPGYIAHMAKMLGHAHIAGQGQSIYYNIRDRNIRRLQNREHVSFCQTGFTNYNIEKLEQAAKIVSTAYAKGQALPMLDILFWRNAAGKRTIETGTKKLCIGIKGLPGRTGIGMGHSRQEPNDPDFSQLKAEIGEGDAGVYIGATSMPEYRGEGHLSSEEFQSRMQVIHGLLRARNIRRLVTGDLALLRYNAETIKLLDKHCTRVEDKVWRIKRNVEIVAEGETRTVDTRFTVTQKDKHLGQTCYIIGKGPGLDTIPFWSAFKPGCPIIAVNEAIHAVEKHDWPENPIYCLQQDTILREKCWSKKGTMLIPFTLRWYNEHPSVLTYIHTDFPLPDKRFPFSVEMSIHVAKCWGCSDIVLMACDASVTKVCDYAISIGHVPAGNKLRYLEHNKYIAKALGDLPYSFMYPKGTIQC